MRDDLAGIPFMKENGFTVDYSSEDKRHKRFETPHDSVGFKNGNFHTWKFVYSTSTGVTMKWQTARLISEGEKGNFFRYHHPVDTLEQAVAYMKETDNQYDNEDKRNMETDPSI
jgi:hypothetical protein